MTAKQNLPKPPAAGGKSDAAKAQASSASKAGGKAPTNPEVATRDSASSASRGDGLRDARHSATTAAENALRARSARNEEEGRRRRRRGDNDQTHQLKLGVRFDKDPNRVYRWINMGVDGQRFYDKCVEDDWDPVNQEGEPTDNVGTMIRRAVGGTNADPVYAVLCSKPRDLYEADVAERERVKNDALMDRIKDGTPLQAAGQRQLTEADNVHGDGVAVSGRL